MKAIWEVILAKANQGNFNFNAQPTLMHAVVPLPSYVCVEVSGPEATQFFFV